MIPIHVSKSSLFKIHFHIFPWSTQGSWKKHNSFRFSHQNPLCISLLSQARNLLNPSYPPWYERCNDVGRKIQIATFLITKYSLTLSFFSPPNFQIFSRHTVFQHIRLYLVSVWVTSLGTIQNKTNIILIYFSFSLCICKNTKYSGPK